MPDRPTLLLTRPAPQSQSFLDALTTALGRQPKAVISPVLRIEPRGFADPGDVQAFVFTSANGVVAFAEQHAPADRLAFCVGDTTAAIARNAGFEAVSAHGDVQALERLLISRTKPGKGPIVHISGEASTGALVQTLVALGHEASRIVGYSQIPQSLSGAAIDTLQTGPTVAPVFSPRSGRILQGELRSRKIMDLTLVAISKAAAKPLSGQVVVATEPTRAAMIAVLLSLM